MIMLGQNTEILDEPNPQGMYVVKMKNKIMEEIMTEDFLNMLMI